MLYLVSLEMKGAKTRSKPSLDSKQGSILIIILIMLITYNIHGYSAYDALGSIAKYFIYIILFVTTTSVNQIL